MMTKNLVLIIALVIPNLSLAQQGDCPHCAEIKDYQTAAAKTPPDVNGAQAGQEAMAEKGATLVHKILRDKQINQDTAEQLLPAMVKVMQYDPSDNVDSNLDCKDFIRLWTQKKANLFKPAMDKLMGARQISAEEHEMLLGACGLLP